MARTKISEVIIGNKINDVYRLLDIKQSGDQVFMQITDASDIEGLPAVISIGRFEKNMMSWKDSAVYFEGVVLPGPNMKPTIKVINMRLAKKSEYIVRDIFNGISEAAKKDYIMQIKNIIKATPNIGCRQLLEAILTEEILEKLSVYPASLNFHGRYRGGALAATAMVTRLVVSTGNELYKHKNGLYNIKIDWSILATASLLHAVGVLDYIQLQPLQKTVSGLQRGYLSILQSTIEKAVYKNNVAISDDTLSAILNALAAAVPMKSEVKATSEEGTILRHSLLLYEEVDRLSDCKGNHQNVDGENAFYDKRLNRMIISQQLPEGGVA